MTDRDRGANAEILLSCKASNDAEVNSLLPICHVVKSILKLDLSCNACKKFTFLIEVLCERFDLSDGMARVNGVGGRVYICVSFIR